MTAGVSRASLTAVEVSLAFALTAACVSPRPYRCVVDEQCGPPGSGASCEPTFHCAFADLTCASGRRYGAHAGDGLAGECTDEIGLPDGAPADAAVHDAAPPADGVDARPPPDGVPDGPAPPDGSTPPDGPSPDGPPPLACGKTSLLADAFEDGARGPDWGSWADLGVGLTEANGVLRLDLASFAASAYGGYWNPQRLDLRDASVRVRVAHVPSGATSQVLYRLDDPDGRELHILFEDGSIGFGRAGADLVPWIPYDPAAHRWWRFREAAGTLYWETSPDDLTYTIRASTAWPLFDASSVSVSLSGGTFGAETAPGYLEYDDVNGGVASGAWCPARTLVDDFEDGVWARGWAYLDQPSGCAAAEAGGVLTVTPPTAVEDCAVASRKAYDLSESSVSVRVAALCTNGPDSCRTYLEARDLRLRRAQLMVKDGELRFPVNDGAGWSEPIPRVVYDAAAHRRWRLRGAGGQLHFETSPDGAAWTDHGSIGTPMTASRVEVVLGVGLDAPGGSTPATFDDLNVP